MAGETFDLGKASLDLDVDLAKFERNIQRGRATAGEMEDALDAIKRVAIVAESRLNEVKMDAAAGMSSQRIADRIERSISGVGRAAMEATQHLQEVKLGAAQAAESDAAGDVIDRKLKDITRNANEARRATESVRIAGGIPGRSGVGVGPFGSGFGRIGLVGGLVGAGVLTAPAAGPAAAGVLAGAAALATPAAIGLVGTLALALSGVGKAISGDKKAFDALQPAQQQFVMTVRSLTGEIHRLKQVAGDSLFPGLEQGLRSALSPSTLGAVTNAIRQFGTAIGQAGTAWGKYFGSAEFASIFGPLMTSGARNVGVLSDAFLHLFDALGVVLRAAIPLADWLAKAIDKGSTLGDVWLHQKDATGQLSGAMKEAQKSMQLVAGLAGALVRVVGELGIALYPVSKIAVKDLTDGLSALSRIIHDNQSAIRAVISEGLAALKTAVELVAGGVGLLVRGLSSIVGQRAATVAAIVGIGAALALAFGAITPGGLIIVGIGLVAVEIVRHWTTVKRWLSGFGDFLVNLFSAAWSAVKGTANLAIYGMLLEVKALAVGLGKALGWIPGLGGKIKHAMEAVSGFVDDFRRRGIADMQRAGDQAGSAWGNAFQSQVRAALAASTQGYNTTGSTTGAGGYSMNPAPGTKGYTVPFSGKSLDGVKESLLDAVRKAVAAVGGTQIIITSAKRPPGPGNDVTNSNHITGDALDGYVIVNGKRVPLGTAIKAVAAKYGLRSGDVAGFDPRTRGGYDPVHVDDGANVGGVRGGGGGSSASPFGAAPPWTTNLGPKGPKGPKPPVIPMRITDLLNRASVNASQAKQLGNVGGTARRFLENELSELKAADVALHKLTPKTAADKQQVKRKITEVENHIRDVQTQIKHSLLVIGDALIPKTLRAQLRAADTKFRADSTFAQVLTGKAAEEYNAVILGDARAKAKILHDEQARLRAKLKHSTGRQRAEVQKELDKIASQLDDVQQQVVSSLQSAVSIAQGRVGSRFQRVVAQFDAQFEAASQKLADALGVKFFQNGAKTPLEQQLADMQTADTLKQLQDAIDNATTPEEKAQAQRAFDENDLAIRAAKERADADNAYADQLKTLQAARAKLEDDMNRKLSDLGDEVQNGTASMSDLAAVAAQYGIQINTETIPDFADLSSAVLDLKSAFQDLIDYIAKLTGKAPTVTGSTGGGGGSSGGVGPGSPGDRDDNQKWMTAILQGALGAGLGFGTTSKIRVPSLDIGGKLLTDGLIYGHKGETVVPADVETPYSGGGDIHFHGGTFIGGDKRRVARDLKPYLDEVIST